MSISYSKEVLETPRQELKPLTKPAFATYFQPSRWKAWWLAKKTRWARKIIAENTLDMDPVLYAEQIMWRRSVCLCWAEGTSKCCGCPARDKLIQATEECTWKFFPKMFTTWREWEQYKRVNKIKL